MKRYILLTGMCFAALIHACKHEPRETPLPTTTTTSSTGGTTTGPPQNDSVCFNTQIQPLFNSSCAMSGCHDAVTRAEGYNFTTYSGIRSGVEPGDPTEGDIMKEIDKGDMPKAPVPPLTADQKALLRKWIKEGALNRNCTGGCDPANATFSAGVNPIIATNCVGCHNNSLPSGGINLAGYNNIKNQAVSGKLLCAIQHGSGCLSMPQNAPKLSDSCIALIQNWVNDGAPDN